MQLAIQGRLKLGLMNNKLLADQTIRAKYCVKFTANKQFFETGKN